MKFSVFAFDNYFEHADRIYGASERWDLQRQLGYDFTYLSINRADPGSWQKLVDAAAETRRTGLELAAVYTVVDLTAPAPSPDRSVAAMLELIPDCGTLELAFTVGWQKELSDPRRDLEVIAFLTPLLQQARARDITISLYPHFGFWMERVEDCIRVAASVNEPNLRVSFSGYHWYVVDGKSLHARLHAAAPWLHHVSLCGTLPKEESSDYPLPVVIAPVGRGDFPLQDFLAGIRSISYSGPVGFQGYLIGGKPEDNLRESINAFRLLA